MVVVLVQIICLTWHLEKLHPLYVAMSDVEWNGMQKQPSCKKEVWPSKVESYLKDECMVWLTTRGDIWMWPRHKYWKPMCGSGATYVIYCII